MRFHRLHILSHRLVHCIIYEESTNSSCVKLLRNIKIPAMRTLQSIVTTRRALRQYEFCVSWLYDIRDRYASYLPRLVGVPREGSIPNS